MIYEVGDVIRYHVPLDVDGYEGFYVGTIVEVRDGSYLVSSYTSPYSERLVLVEEDNIIKYIRGNNALLG